MTTRARAGTKKRRPRSRDVQHREDNWVNRASGVGTSRDRRMWSQISTEFVPDIEAAALWRNDWVIARIIELGIDDGTRPGFNLKIAKSKGDPKKLAEAVMKDAERLFVRDRLANLGKWNKAYGGGALFPVLEGAVGSLHEPLDGYLDSIVRVSAIHMLEPRELRPYTWYRDLNHPKFRKPELYQIWPLSGVQATALSAQLIHESRLGLMYGKIISNQLQPGQRPGWGDSVVSLVRQVAADFGLDWASVSTLLQDFAQGVLSLEGMTELLQTEGGIEVVRRKIAMIDEARSVLRSMVIDKNDTFQRTTTPVGGLDALMVQAAQIVAAAAGMPATRLLGLSPAGFSNGESDIRAWYDTCDIDRQALNPVLLWLMKLLMLAGDGPCAGVEPEVWSCPWNPLWQPSDKEIAETRKTDSEADVNWFGIGVASALDIAKSHWSGDTYSRDLQVDLKAIEEQQKLMATDPGTTEEPQPKLDENGDPVLDENGDPVMEQPAVDDGSEGKTASEVMDEATSDNAKDPEEESGAKVTTVKKPPPAGPKGRTVNVAAHKRAVV